jgi:ubiquinone biosynthesis monooxygenase Coq7
MNLVDRLIVGFDNGLRTLAATAVSARAHPDAELPEAEMTPDQKRHAASLMRVNHTGEICAQALYAGQALTAKDADVREVLARAGREEVDHLAWTERRIEALGGRTSVLNPLFYAGSFALGALSGLAGDRWNLGFLAETERQVESHLRDHLDRLPEVDARSRAVVDQMRADEGRHADTAMAHGGTPLPGPVQAVMKVMAKVMTSSTYRI